MEDDLVKIPENFSFKGLDEILTNPETQKYMAEQMQQQIYEKVSSVPKTDVTFKNPLEKTENLLEEQLKHETNQSTELQEKLNEAYDQLRQLNDKDSIQVSELKQLRADLKEESLKRELAESKLSSKDWKTAIIALGTGIFVLAVEHWKDIYDFILSLIGLQR